MQHMLSKAPEAIYENGDYMELNTSWHVEDSPWKSEQVLKFIRKHGLQPETICEVGCGAGEVLVQLARALPGVTFTGYDISPSVLTLWAQRSQYGITFIQKDFLDDTNTYDMLLFVDVIEHIEDYIGFLRKAKGRATHYIFNFPLEIFALKALLGHKYVESRARYGHIHYFNKDICLDVLDHLDFEIVDWFYAPSAIDLADTTTSISQLSKLLRIPRLALGRISTELSAKMLGGYSLFVLAK